MLLMLRAGIERAPDGDDAAILHGHAGGGWPARVHRDHFATKTVVESVGDCAAQTCDDATARAAARSMPTIIAGQREPSNAARAPRRTPVPLRPKFRTHVSAVTAPRGEQHGEIVAVDAATAVQIGGAGACAGSPGIEHGTQVGTVDDAVTV